MSKGGGNEERQHKVMMTLIICLLLIVVLISNGNLRNSNAKMREKINILETSAKELDAQLVEINTKINGIITREKEYVKTEKLNSNNSLAGLKDGIGEIRKLDGGTLGEAIEANYVIMWEYQDDAEQNHRGKYVSISGKVDSISKGNGKKNDIIYIKEGLTGITGNISMEIADYGGYSVKEDDYITIVGKVESKFFGILNMRNCVVQDVGEKSMLKTAENRENTEGHRESLERKKNEEKDAKVKHLLDSAEDVSYKELIDFPDKYEGKNIKVEVKVAKIDSIITSKESRYKCYDKDGEWLINYKSNPDSKRIYKDDVVTFYGTFDGVVKRSDGDTKTIEYLPSIIALVHK